MRSHRALLTLAAALAVLLLAAPAATAAPPTAAGSTPHHPGARGNTTQTAVTLTADGVEIDGVDLHDGTVAHFGGTYYLYGTEYGCGFTWGIDGTPFCGFGVATAPSLAGPWSTPTLLFNPATATDPYTTRTWTSLCGLGGAGCFNPRMLQRPDGVYVLWFNSPATYSAYGGANAYNAMGCNSPAGPCGKEAGAPSGSSNKPALYTCASNGDFTIVTAAPAAYIICTTPGQGFSEEPLDTWWTNGSKTGGTANWAGYSQVESPGAYRDPATGTWILTYSKPNCGYCSGAGTGYATASSPAGPWTRPADLSQGGPGGGGRSYLSATSCGGQPRTVAVVDGQAYQWVDLWTGARNETSAGVYLVPLIYNPGLQHGVAGDAHPWHPPFADWTCN